MATMRFWRPSSMGPQMPRLKKLIWAYFLLLIFEGALRKWILPQLSAPLLVIRVPIALAIIWEAFRTHKWPKPWSVAVGPLGLLMLALCIAQAIFAGNPWFASLFGLVAYALPFPVAFIIGNALDAEDLRKFGMCTLLLLFPITALEVAQYYAPAHSVLNAASYEGLTHLVSAGGHIRASGTFSDAKGPTYFLPMAAAFIFYGLANSKFAKKWLLWAASIALVIAIPVTGSRTVLMMTASVVGCVAVAALAGQSQLMGTVKVILAFSLAAAVVSQLPVFSEATNTMQERLTTADEQEGGTTGTVDKRILAPILGALDTDSSVAPWYGLGLGLGSNPIAVLTTGTAQFLAGEDEVTRVVNEFGPPFGLPFMAFRMVLAIAIAFTALARVRSRGPLAWFLAPAMFTALFTGTLEQLTINGFMVILVGFSLAAFRRDTGPAPVAPDPVNRQWMRRRTIPVHGSGSTP